jgi:hypothetical protein
MLHEIAGRIRNLRVLRASVVNSSETDFTG